MRLDLYADCFDKCYTTSRKLAATGIFDFKANFNNIGSNILNLVFEDVVMTNKLIKGKVPIYEQYTSISLPVYVKEEDITESFVHNGNGLN